MLSCVVHFIFTIVDVPILYNAVAIVDLVAFMLLTKAFNIISRSILLRRLQYISRHMIGLKVTFRVWKQYVMAEKVQSEPLNIKIGPRKYIRTPIIYIVY